MCLPLYKSSHKYVGIETRKLLLQIWRQIISLSFVKKILPVIADALISTQYIRLILKYVTLFSFSVPVPFFPIYFRYNSSFQSHPNLNEICWNTTWNNIPTSRCNINGRRSCKISIHCCVIAVLPLSYFSYSLFISMVFLLPVITGIIEKTANRA